jgi:hypothetical protein
VVKDDRDRKRQLRGIDMGDGDWPCQWRKSRQEGVRE